VNDVLDTLTSQPAAQSRFSIVGRILETRSAQKLCRSNRSMGLRGEY
jgi:hypothetical protein